VSYGSAWLLELGTEGALQKAVARRLLQIQIAAGVAGGHDLRLDTPLLRRLVRQSARVGLLPDAQWVCRGCGASALFNSWGLWTNWSAEERMRVYMQAWHEDKQDRLEFMLRCPGAAPIRQAEPPGGYESPAVPEETVL